MKAIIDTNVVISYLLAPQAQTNARAIVWAALDQTFEASISDQTVQELVRVTRDTPYLAARIDPDHVRELIALFMELGIVDPVAPTSSVSRVRDPKDEYLIDHAITAAVDYLVTGDRDLLELKHDFGFRIVTPAGFLETLAHETRDS